MCARDKYIKTICTSVQMYLLQMLFARVELPPKGEAVQWLHQIFSLLIAAEHTEYEGLEYWYGVEFQLI